MGNFFKINIALTSSQLAALNVSLVSATIRVKQAAIIEHMDYDNR